MKFFDVFQIFKKLSHELFIESTSEVHHHQSNYVAGGALAGLAPDTVARFAPICAKKKIIGRLLKPLPNVEACRAF